MSRPSQRTRKAGPGDNGPVPTLGFPKWRAPREMALPLARAAVTRRLNAGAVELPASFVTSTFAAEAMLLAIPASRRTKAQRAILRRLARHCNKLERG